MLYANGDGLVYEDNTDLFDISQEGKIEFTPIFEQLGSYLIKITVKNSLGNEEERLFNLEVIDTNTAPDIVEITDQNAKVGEMFVYQVVAADQEKDEIVFMDDTNLFDISLDGVINFIPTKDDIGFHIIKITVSDGKHETKAWMYLTIEWKKQLLV